MTCRKRLRVIVISSSRNTLVRRGGTVVVVRLFSAAVSVAQSGQCDVRCLARTDGEACRSALQAAAQLLQENYLDIESHAASAICFGKAGDVKAARQHDFVARGLMRAILSSGDGKTLETAYLVISFDEEYTLLGTQGLRKTRQS